MAIPLRVLIVEDSEDDTMLLLIELKRGGYETTWKRVENPHSMLEALEREEWDIVVSDYVMPNFSGFAALKLLQQKGLDIPFIIVSGKIGEDTAVEAMIAGAHDYIIKGNLARLNPAISRELREAAIRRERKRAVKELAESREILKLVIDNIPQFIFWKNHNTYLGCNKKTIQVSGTPECVLPWKQVDHHFEREQRIMESDDPELHVIEPVEMLDGRQAWLDISRVPMHDDHGKVIGLLGVFEDITERVKAEQELQERRERERRIQAEAEEAKRQFYRGTIASVTGGKLNLVSYDEIREQLAPCSECVPIKGGADLHEVRSKVGEYARVAGLKDDEVDELILAAGEAAANALKHVKEGQARIGMKGDSVQVCIQDEGPGIDTLVLPKATLMPGFSTKPSMGMGYSLILASVDKVFLATDKLGTWVLMEKKPQTEFTHISLDNFPDNW